MKLTREQEDALNVDVGKAIGWTKKHWLAWSSDLDCAFLLLAAKRWDLSTWDTGFKCSIVNLTRARPFADGIGATIPEAICRAVIAESQNEKENGH